MTRAEDLASAQNSFKEFKKAFERATLGFVVAVFSRRGRFFLVSIVTLSDSNSYLMTRGSVARAVR